MLKTFEINISGQVQGVGFRPHVYSKALHFNLKGTVSNNENGVVILVTGTKKDIDNFYADLLINNPPLSIILEGLISQKEYREYSDFKIVSSITKGKLNLALTPDFAICKNCENEILNNNNRRYFYPFTTCVNCGPRWAVTKSFPFERANTSISSFTMCPECNNEYTNVSDRRFHSQTNTCHSCGIKMSLIDNSGRKVKLDGKDIFDKASDLLRDGKIIAIKNTSGYLLCCDANNNTSIRRLRNKKRRPNKPFAVLYPSLEKVELDFKISEAQKNAFQSTERPIVLLPKGNSLIEIDIIAPKLNHIGITLPYTGILQLLIQEFKHPLIATSGNLHGSPILSDTEVAFLSLKNVVDYFLDHNLEITNPQDDSVVKYSEKYSQEVLFRRSRGYAPNYFGGAIFSKEKILAMGAHLKSTISFFPNKFLYVSQFLGNLDNYDVYIRYTDTLNKFINFFDEDPEIILIDSHPTYQSSLLGKEIAPNFGASLFEVQHHKAHFASVLAEHNLFKKKKSILGIVWDGTGYGDDQHIWGGEFFSYESSGIKRIAHFSYFNWLAGDKMSKEPRLSLMALGSPEMETFIDNKFSKEEISIYRKLMKSNKLKTSSVGRLFDAVASLLELCDINTYEGEAAIILENQVVSYNLKDCVSYFKLENTIDISSFDILFNLYQDYKRGVNKETVILNFIFTLASIVIEFARLMEFKEVACSGGVFQNTILIDMLKEMAGKNIKLYFNRKLAPNDENISFGQMAYYLNGIDSGSSIQAAL